MVMLRLILVLLGVMASLAVAPVQVLSVFYATVQQETVTAEAGQQSARFFPDASAFGDEWQQEQTAGIQVPSDIFREASKAVYGGPNGARIVVTAYVVTDSRVAIRQSWEEATTTFDRSRYYVASDYDYSQLERLEGLEPPPGCVEAKRAEGSDELFAFRGGVTMCAVDPDTILLAVVSGEIDGVSGYQASDAVIAATLSAGE